MIIEKEILNQRDKTLKIWVLDPNEDDTRLIKMVLEKKRGYEVDIFKNASHVIRGLHETTDVDLIITEFDLEGKKNGLEFISHVINSIPHPPPIIMVSNQTNENVAVDCIKYGAMDYISKGRGWYNHLPLRVIHTLVHRQVIEENKELKNLRDAVFDQMFDSIVVTNNKGQILLCNENFSQLTGYSQREIIDSTSFNINMFFADKDSTAKMISDVTQGLVIKNKKGSIQSKDNNIPVSYSATYMPLVDKVVFIFANLQQSESMIRQINELKKYARSAMVISAFKVGENGPEILCFEQSPLFDEETLMKMAIFFSVSLGQGDLIHSGIYGPLPIPIASEEKYISLIYSFIISDPDNNDVRANGRSYSLITINIPEKLVDVFNRRRFLSNLFEQALLDFDIKQIADINEEFLLVVKERVLMMEIDSSMLEM